MFFNLISPEQDRRGTSELRIAAAEFVLVEHEERAEPVASEIRAHFDIQLHKQRIKENSRGVRGINIRLTAMYSDMRLLLRPG